MKRIITNPKIGSIRHHYHYHKVFTSSSSSKRSKLPLAGSKIITTTPSSSSGNNNNNASVCESFLVNNKEMIKKVLFLIVFAVSESLPFLETDSNGIFHHIGNTLKKVTSNNSREE